MVVGRCPRCGGEDSLEKNGWHRECLKAQVRLREALPELEQAPEPELQSTLIVEPVVGISLRPQKVNGFRQGSTLYGASCRCDGCEEWKSSDGTVPICQMGDKHLVAAKGVIERRNWDGASEWVRERWEEKQEAIEAEIARRDL